MTEPLPALNARLVGREDLHDHLALFRVAYDAGAGEHTFEPGQFVNVGCHTEGELLKRPFSMASAPKDDSFEFFVRLVDEGAFTPRLFATEVGAPLWMDPNPEGFFTLAEVPEGRDLVLVGTGTGLGPFMAMLRHYRGTGRWKRVVIVHGSRVEADLGYRAELEEAAKSDEVFYLPILSREPEGSAWNGARGRVNALLEPETYERLVGAPLSPERCTAFLCGNPEMVREVDQGLRALGFSLHTKRKPGEIFKERYW